MADEKVVVKLKLDGEEFDATLKEMPKKFKESGSKSGKSFSGAFKDKIKDIGKSIGGAIASFIKFQIIALGIAGVIFLKKAIDEAIKLEAALTGLKGIAGSLGANVKKVTAAAKQLASDGMVPLSDVTNTMKNLLITFNGDLTKSVKIFKVFRNAAAFGREATRSLGNAISTAAEGLKGDNSAKLDNIGITKNISKFNIAYAKSIEKTVAELTEADIAQSKYNGLMKEGARFIGDYAKLVNTFSGAQSRIRGATTALLAEVGQIITKSPLVIQYLKDEALWIENITKRVNEFVESGGIKKFLLKMIEIGVAINKEIVLPLNNILETAAIVSAGLQVFLAGALIGFAKLGKVILWVLASLGIENPFQELEDGLVKLDKFSLENFRQQLADLKDLQKSTFGEEAQARIAAFLERFKEKVEAGAPAVTQLGNDVAIAQAKIEALEKAAKQTGEAVASAFNQGMVKAITFGIQTMVNSLILGEFSFKTFSSAILGMMGDMAIQMGQTLLLTGIGISSLFALSGPAAIAAGIGLIALGSVLKAFSGGGSAPAGGGLGNSEVNPVKTEEIGGEPAERESPSTQVVVNIQGDILDSEETGNRIAQILNDTFEKEGIVINRGLVA